MHEAPQWRRRTIEVHVKEAGPGRFTATVTSRRFRPPGPVRRLVEAVPGYWLERGLRRVLGRKQETSISYQVGSLRTSSLLRVGDETIQADSIEAIALQGWQEEFGLASVWDVMLLGPDRDLLVGHKSRDEAHEFAAKLALALAVPLRESSVIGGSLTATTATMSARDMRYDAPRVDGWRHLK